MAFIAPVFAWVGTTIGGAAGATAGMTAAEAATATAAATATGAGIVGGVATLGAAGYSAYSQYQAGRSAQALSNYNSQLKMQDAQATLKASAARAASEREQGNAFMAATEAKAAAGGVVTNTGSPLTLSVRNAQRLELHALNTEYTGDMASRTGYQEAAIDQMQGNIARRSSDLNAAGTILSGAGRAASGYLGYG